MNVLELINVSKVYRMDGVSVVALDSTSLKINRGDFISIIGPSGSGKSTLMHLLGILDKPTSGEIVLEGKKINYQDDQLLASLRNKKIGFIFQAFNLLSKTTALSNVELPLIYSGVPRLERKQKAEALLEEVGLSARISHFPNQLSGGEKQRVAIARALINDPAIILADEPTGNLDSKSGKEILEILKKINKQGNTVVLVTHDMEIAKMAKKIIRMKDGKIQK